MVLQCGAGETGHKWETIVQHTIRREARVEALSAIIEVEGTTVAKGS